ncbi:hypothetical protein [Lysinibacillus pakistanensis]|uniref:Uncharacterized protein n=1 Tax=Lysinibacillus pakistanensis TaxID=759811 RepID=A0AAX3X142_9BACI|nr:hypothetical protein [Lysinibacillus pakistanensis]MDM5233400.1 hypothetical protein [Lysinibacillus pakistanensis]WHY48874.1 hypothetical protein QNH22_11820 [Lysinibacillus pakistanensis]WHY53886.1 hypothetical protein QNH24_11800 [Lysinibacillus pakistanensis]
MQIRFELEDDTSILDNLYFDGYIKVIANDNNEDALLFFTTTGHSTILGEFTSILKTLYQTGKSQLLDPFGNADILTLEKNGSKLIISHSKKIGENSDYLHSFNFTEFLTAYIKELQRYLTTASKADANIVTFETYVYLKRGLDTLQEIIK